MTLLSWIPASEKRVRLYQLIIPFFFLIFSSYVAFVLHQTFEEGDGVMMVLASEELFSGNGYAGWTSISWPPLFTVLVGILQFFVDGFTAGKIISVISGVSILILLPELARELGVSDSKHHVIIQLSVALNPLFVILSIIVENHQLEALFFVISTILILRIVNHRRDIISTLDHVQSCSMPEVFWKTRVRDVWLLGITSALACLTRYTSYVLLAVAALVFIYLSFSKMLLEDLPSSRWKSSFRRLFIISMMMIIPFFLISLPWYVANTLENGWFLANSSHLNIGFAVVDNLHRRWWWKTMADYPTLFSVITRHPIAYLRNFVDNILSLPWEFLYLMGWFLPLTVISIGRGIWQSETRTPILVILGLLGFYTLGISQAFYFHELFIIHVILLTTITISQVLSWLSTNWGSKSQDSFSRKKASVELNVHLLTLFFFILLSYYVLPDKDRFSLENVIFMVYIPLLLIGLLLKSNFLKGLIHRPDLRLKVVLGLMIVFGLAYSGGSLAYRVDEYLQKERDDRGELPLLMTVAQFLKRHDPQIHQKFIMTSHPAYAYHVGAKLLILPGYYEGSLEDMVMYKNLPPPVVKFVQKYPSHPDGPLVASYLIWTPYCNKILPQFSFLLANDTNSIKLVPKAFKLIFFVSGKVAVYSINTTLLTGR